jgi:predicted permease
MNLMHWVLLRLRAMTRRGRLERDMQSEMRQHIEQATDRYIARGMSPVEARESAIREFGNLGKLQEEARDARGARWLEELGADLRFAFRHFARRKLSAATIVIVLALGIGANTALFSFLQAWFTRPAPAVPSDDAHVRLFGYEAPSRGAAWQPRAFSQDELLALAERGETFSSLAGWVTQDVVLNPGDSIGPRGVGADFVTPNFFATIGVPLAAGPGFVQQMPDDADMAVVVAHALAGELFGNPLLAIGKTLTVNEVPVRVVGVAPPRFQGAIPNGARPVLWLPVSARADIARTSPRWLTDSAQLTLFGRLAPGVSREGATAITRQVLARALPDSAARLGMSRVQFVTTLRALPPLGDRDGLIGIAMVGLMGLLILLVACMSVSAMMVAAAVGRRQEIAVRLSLGASRWRVLRQLVTESSLLAIAGGSAGLLLYWWISTYLGRTQTMMQVDLSPDFGTFAFMLLVAVGTGLIFGLSPALHATRSGVASALRDSGSGATSRSRLQRGFVVAQIVFSQPLLIILAITLAEALHDGTPLSSEVSQRVIRVGVRPVEQSESEQRATSVDSLVPRLASHGEVISVVPEARAFTIRNVVRPMPDDSAAIGAVVHLEGAAPGWFALRDVPIVLGRDVALADTAEADVPVVIGTTLARALWGDANPIGRVMPSPSPGSKRFDQDSIAMRVVGVYDSRHATTRGSTVERVFTAHGKEWRTDVLLVRTRGSAEHFLPELRQLIRDSAPSLPVASMLTLAHVNARERREAIQVTVGVAAAGGLALLLASLGLYGVVSLAVQQRRREIGVRIAVGAQPSRVAAMFLASGVRVGAVALCIGLPVSLVAFRVLIAQGVLIVPRVNFWMVGLSIAAILMAVASAATWLPARQAARVDPAMTLRVE